MLKDYIIVRTLVLQITSKKTLVKFISAQMQIDDYEFGKPNIHIDIFKVKVIRTY